MIFVVDSNIVFSALLNPNSIVGEVLFDIQNQFEFYAPEFLVTEIEKYSDKIAKYTKLNDENLKVVKTSVLSSIRLISEELISENSWNNAIELTKNIDENDTPFVALSIELNTKLWTGDKKLIKGISRKQNGLAITTEEMKELIK